MLLAGFHNRYNEGHDVNDKYVDMNIILANDRQTCKPLLRKRRPEAVDDEFRAACLFISSPNFCTKERRGA